MLKTLLKIQFASFKASLMRNRRRQAKGGAGRTIGMALLFLYVIVCFFIMFGSMFSTLCLPLHQIELDWLYFAIAGLMSFMLTFIGNVFATQTQLFDAKDNELLLSMRPSSPSSFWAAVCCCSLRWISVMFCWSWRPPGWSITGRWEPPP